MRPIVPHLHPMQPIGTTHRVMTRVRDGVLFHTRGHIGKELKPQTRKETIVEHLISGQLMRGEELEEGVIKVEETKVEATGAGELEAPGGVGVGVGVEEGDRCRQRIFVACVLLRDCRFVSNIFTLWLFEHKNVKMVFFLLCS